MYAGINNLKSMMVFFKKYLHGGGLDITWLHGDMDVYKFRFANGDVWTGIDADIFERWALCLKNDGLMNVFAYDITEAYGNEAKIYCALPERPVTWTMERNLNAGNAAYPEKYYISEYTESVLPPDASAPFVADPTEKLEAAVGEYLRLVKNVVKHDAYSADASYFTKPLLQILDALHGRITFPPYGMWQNNLALSSAKDTRLYHAHMYTNWFLNDINGKNENVPYNLFEVCENAGRELRLQGDRALLYVLNHL